MNRGEDAERFGSVDEPGNRKVDVRLPGKENWREAGPPNHHGDKVDSDQ